jgi:inner membrane protein
MENESKIIIDNENTLSIEKSTTKNFTNSLTTKLVMLGILILVMMMPISSINNLIRERKSRSQKVIEEISEKWGKPQTLDGPVLSIPYDVYTTKYNVEKKKEETVKEVEYLHVLPESLNYNCEILPEERYRGIFKVIVYKAKVELDGEFELPDLDYLDITKENIHWDRVLVSIRLSDFRSLQQNLFINFDNQKIEFKPGTTKGLKSGVHANINLDSEKKYWKFNSSIDFNGSSDIMFSPLGKTTNVQMKSNWNNPSFVGKFLPDERKVDENGFTATWKVLQLNRSINQYYNKTNYISYNKIVNEIDFNDDTSGDNYNFGVNLLVPVDHYKKSERSAKYALMFIALTFISFFALGLTLKLDIHITQYLLIGFALSIFYCLLLSISEHLGFDIAYWISVVGMIVLFGGFTKALFKNTRFTLMLIAIIFILYSFIYVVIQLQDYSLLIGSIGLFIIVSCLMYFSTKINFNETR